MALLLTARALSPGDGKGYRSFLDLSERLHRISDGYFLWRSVESVLWKVKAEAPAALEAVGPLGHDWGSTRALGYTLFGDYLFPFEAVSILLLIAVVGALAVARPKELAEQQESQS